jgi:xanthine dehydrogenase YagR molybdenum-binding subunit
VAKPLQPPAPGRGGAAPAPADPKFAWPAERAVLGTSVKRLDGPDKVTGRARYTFDITRPGMLYGRIVRSPHPHARVVSVDLRAAQRAPGVKAALVWKDRPTPNNRVMFQGDEVAGVAADTEEHAIDAARLIAVEYEVLPHLTVVEQALSGTAPAVFTGGNVRQGQTQEAGDLAAGFRPRGAHHRGDLRDARHHARVHGVARHGVRVGRRQADGLDLDAGRSTARARTSPPRSSIPQPTCASSASTWAAASAARR